jgi:hypothetical protein
MPICITNQNTIEFVFGGGGSAVFSPQPLTSYNRAKLVSTGKMTMNTSGTGTHNPGEQIAATGVR